MLSHALRQEQQAVFLDPGGGQAGATYFQAAPAAPQFLQLADGSTVAVSTQPQPQYQLITSVGGGYPQLMSMSGQPATYVHTTGPPQLVTIGGGAPQLVSMVGGQPQLVTTLGSGTMPQLVTIQQGAGGHHAHPQLVTIGGAVHHATVPQPLAPGPHLVGNFVPSGQPKIQLQQQNSSGQPPVLRAASSTSVGLSVGPGGQLYYTPSQQP